MIAWRTVAMGTWTTVDGVGCPLWDQTANDRESHGATETHRPERGLVWGCFHLLRHQTGEVCSTGQTALLMFLKVSLYKPILNESTG